MRLRLREDRRGISGAETLALTASALGLLFLISLILAQPGRLVVSIVIGAASLLAIRLLANRDPL